MAAGSLSSDMLKRAIENMKSQSDAEPKPETNTVPIQTVESMHQAKLKAFLDRPIRVIQKDVLGERMALVKWKIQSKNDWKDLQPGSRKVYNLYKIQDKSVLVQKGMKVINSLRGVVTENSIADLMLVAYNLMTDSGDQRCFGEVPAELEPQVRDEFDSVPEKVICTVYSAANLTVTLPITDPDYNQKVANALCYLAASYMRLYTKSADNYVKIENHLSEKFFNFYGYPFPLINFHPPLDTIKAVKSYLQLNTVLKSTFYNFLYAGEMEPVGKNLKDFLYVIHTSHTGLHAFILFGRIMEAMKLSNRELTDYMHCGGTAPELESLALVFTDLLATEDEAYKLNMWRFGRIFDSDFLTMLQTKNTKFFTAICANILHIVAKDEHSSILNIAHIANMDDTMKRRARAFALRVVQNAYFCQISRKL